MIRTQMPIQYIFVSIKLKSTSFRVYLLLRQLLSCLFLFLKYCRTHNSPCNIKELSTKSPPSSYLLKGFTLPVLPFHQCGSLDDLLFQKCKMVSNLYSLSSSNEPRSIPTKMAITPKPPPPLVTTSWSFCG